MFVNGTWRQATNSNHIMRLANLKFRCRSVRLISGCRGRNCGAYRCFVLLLVCWRRSNWIESPLWRGWLLAGLTLLLLVVASGLVVIKHDLVNVIQLFHRLDSLWLNVECIEFHLIYSVTHLYSRSLSVVVRLVVRKLLAPT